MTGGSPHLVRTLVQMDAPDHPKYRALTQAWFMPPKLRRLDGGGSARSRAASVERMAATGGACDFVTEVALHLSAARDHGDPRRARGRTSRMLMLTQELFGARIPNSARDPEELDTPNRQTR